MTSQKNAHINRDITDGNTDWSNEERIPDICSHQRLFQPETRNNKSPLNTREQKAQHPQRLVQSKGKTLNSTHGWWQHSTHANTATETSVPSIRQPPTSAAPGWVTKNQLLTVSNRWWYFRSMTFSSFSPVPKQKNVPMLYKFRTKL